MKKIKREISKNKIAKVLTIGLYSVMFSSSINNHILSAKLRISYEAYFIDIIIFVISD